MGDVKKCGWETYEHWSQCLRCAICFCCVKDPHTLQCGHTFCKKCLKKLASIEREDNPGISRRNLVLVCPSCRNFFPAKPTLKGRTSTNITMQHVVEMWENECQMLLNSIIRLRSISTQTTEAVGSPISQNPKLNPKRNAKFDDSNIKPNPNNNIKLSSPSEQIENSTSSIKNTPDISKSSEFLLPKTKDIFPCGETIPPKLTKSTTSIKHPPPVSTKTSDSNCSEDVEFTEHVRPGRKYLDVLLRRALEFYEDREEEQTYKIKDKTRSRRNSSSQIVRRRTSSQRVSTNQQIITTPSFPPTDLSSAHHGDNSAHHGDNSSSSETDASSSSSNSAATDVNNSDASISEIFGRMSFPNISIRREFTIGRILLIVMWFLYSMIIIAIADSFLPYVTVATFFTFLLFLG